jgi:hypothetical protein
MKAQDFSAIVVRNHCLLMFFLFKLNSPIYEMFLSEKVPLPLQPCCQSLPELTISSRQLIYKLLNR